jgi:hypothetical protein
MNPDQVKFIGKELQVGLSSEEHALYFHGESMLPFLREGDLLIVRPIAFDDVQRGDIITYRNGDKFPTQRVFEKHKHLLSMRCDSWKKFTNDVSPDDVLGRAEAQCRDGQWITMSSAKWQRAARRSLRRALIRAWRRALQSRLRSAKRRVRL